MESSVVRSSKSTSSLLEAKPANELCELFLQRRLVSGPVLGASDPDPELLVVGLSQGFDDQSHLSRMHDLNSEGTSLAAFCDKMHSQVSRGLPSYLVKVSYIGVLDHEVRLVCIKRPF